ncbi:hypothetical protein AGMMS4956_14670 [Bacteroidia bacterium]|nr:hypothetical protein AGMMS4956_14670 [Bacteroidia bacterium]
MKNFYLFIAAIFLVGACNPKEENAGNHPALKLTATMGAFTSQDAALAIRWPDAATIGLFEFDTRSNIFTNSNRPMLLGQGKGLSDAQFEGQAQSSDGWLDDEKIFYAYYPYNQTQTMASAVTFAVPTKQTMSAGDSLAHLVDGLFMTSTSTIAAGHASEAALTLAPATTALFFEIINQTTTPLPIDTVKMAVSGAYLYKSGTYNFRQNAYNFTTTDQTSNITLKFDQIATLAVGEKIRCAITLFPLEIPQGGSLDLEIYTNNRIALASKVAELAPMVFDAGKLYTASVVIDSAAFNAAIALPERQNSFIIAPRNDGEDALFTIPVSRVNEFWRTADLSKVIGNDDNWVVEIIWQDFDLAGNDVLTITPGKERGKGPLSRFGLTLKKYPADQWGNAVVGVRKADNDGNPTSDYLWSWHVWVSDFDATTTTNIVTYPTSGKIGMNRNLGAKNATKGNVGALGLMYQFGRKDPFPGAVSTNVGTTAKAATTNSTSWTTVDPDIGGTFAYTNQHPTTFVTAITDASTCLNTTVAKEINRGSWYQQPSGDNACLWAWNQTTVKSINDPCPKGWKVPDNTNAEGNAANAANQTWFGFTNANWTYDPTNRGRIFNNDWWPMAGWLDPFTGEPMEVGTAIYMVSTRSGTPNGTTVVNAMSFGLYGDASTTVTPRYGNIRQAAGASVRCVRFTPDD